MEKETNISAVLYQLVKDLSHYQERYVLFGIIAELNGSLVSEGYTDEFKFCIRTALQKLHDNYRLTDEEYQTLQVIVKKEIK